MTRFCRLLFRTALGPVLLVVGLALGLVTAGCAGPSAEELVREMSLSAEQLQDYEAVLALTYSFAASDETREIRQSFKRPNLHRLEFLSPPEFKGQLTVYDGQTLWSYSPQDNEVIVFEGNAEDAAGQDQRSLISGVVEQVKEAAGVKLAGRGKVDGRSTYVLEITPSTPKSEGLVVREKVWVDRQDWLPLKVESYNSAGKLVMSAVYTQIKVNSGLDDGLFTFSVPSGADVIQGGAEPQEITIEEARLSSGFTLLLPAHLPTGTSLFQVTRVGTGPDVQILLDYGSDQNNLSITENKAQPGATPMPGLTPTDLGGLAVELIQSEDFSILHWTVGDVELTITSNLALEELGKIARSMR